MLKMRVLMLAAIAALLMSGVARGQVAGAGPQKLMITILDGDGALNNIRQRDAREPIVQVTDENHKPVGGALVLFAIHGGSGGAGATFDGAQTLTVRTGEDGIAHASGLQLAKSPGSFTISVTASVAVAAGVAAGLSALVSSEVLIHQSNIIGALSTTTASGASGASATGAEAGASGASAGGAGASATVTHTGLSKLLHLSRTANIAIASAAVAAAVVVTVVVVTQNNSTSLTLGTSTVGHP
jgi:hypothetical protein